MTQDAENWEQLQALFFLVESVPESERERLLEEQCPDAGIRQRVMEILKASQAKREDEAPSGAPALTGKMGPYTVIRHIGAGGIGSVYLVERIVGGALQRSALKVLAPHAAGPMFVERFRREQHILASLEHANITRMLDAGLTETGHPYLVMEYVDGVQLDAYCNEHALSIPARIELFLQVCDAVAYAHRNLIVHLDLKPSNILVTADGTVKLLDFGTSKMIQPDRFLTTTVMATPAYASPEQLRNEPVTTACDVYALGAILFELLAGHRPNDRASSAELMERAFREKEPEPLPNAVTTAAAELCGLSENRLRQLLSGDLATIVAKCLRPRPQDRYASLDSLVGDIQRYSTGMPILAHPQTAWYRLSKFTRRHRAGVLTSAAVALVLMGTLGYAAWRQQQAVREGQRALRMQNFISRVFKLANSNHTGKASTTVPEFLQIGVKALPEYIKNPADLRRAQNSLAESMYENGDLDGAQKVFTQTVATAKAADDIEAEAEAEAYSGNIAYLQGNMELGQTLTAHALELSRQPGISPSVRVWSAIFYAWNRDNNGFRDDENVRLLQFAVKECRDNKLSANETADALYNLGQDLELRGRLDEAESIFNQSLDAYGQDPSTLCERSEVLGELAYVTDMRGDTAASVPIFQRSYDGFSACSGPESRGALTQVEYLTGALIKLGRASEALPKIEAAMPPLRKILGASPDLAEPLNFLAEADVATGHFTEAEQTAKEMVDVQTGKVASTDRRFGASHLLWAEALAGEHRYPEALPHAEIADRLLAMNAVSEGAKARSAEAHKLLLEVRGKIAAR
jgi:eukaryotic-like serine/threonine-protein kinase